MHAIDTNVLMRIIVKDDEHQTNKAKKYIENQYRFLRLSHWINYKTS